jgi:hypothetical protein
MRLLFVLLVTATLSSGCIRLPAAVRAEVRESVPPAPNHFRKAPVENDAR